MTRDYLIGYKICRKVLVGPDRGRLISMAGNLDLRPQGTVRYFMNQWVQPQWGRHCPASNGPLCVFANKTDALTVLQNRCADSDFRRFNLYQVHYRPWTKGTFRGGDIWFFMPDGPDDQDPEYAATTLSAISEVCPGTVLASEVKLVRRIDIPDEDRPYDPDGAPHG